MTTSKGGEKEKTPQHSSYKEDEEGCVWAPGASHAGGEWEWNLCASLMGFFYNMRDLWSVWRRNGVTVKLQNYA